MTDAIFSMGKGDSSSNLEQQQRHDDDHDERRNRSRLFLCKRCSMGLSRISFKCVFILMLSLCLLVSALFWIFPSSLHSVSGFDAKDEVKLSGNYIIPFLFVCLIRVSFLMIWANGLSLFSFPPSCY